MGQKLSPDQMALYRRVDEVLTYVWDPIGVREVPQARDEYRGYLPKVFELVLDSTGPDPIVDYLLWAEAESMGLTPSDKSRKETFRIARLLIEHRDWINQTHPDQ